MSETTRRGFLTTARVGVAGLVVGGAAGAGITYAAENDKTTALPPGVEGPLLAYVTDVHSGEISILIGDKEIVVHDREVVARIAQAAKKA